MEAMGIKQEDIGEVPQKKGGSGKTANSSGGQSDRSGGPGSG